MTSELTPVDALRADVVQVVDEIVGHLGALRGDLEASRGGAELQLLQRRVSALESRLSEIGAWRESMNRDRIRDAYAHMSRIHEKQRTVVFVGRDYFGDNVKYAYLAALDSVDGRGGESWFLPFDAAQERIVTALGGRCLPADPADWSAAHVSLALETAVLVTCDHFGPDCHPNPYAPSLFAGARCVQLWHGISIKEIGLRNQAPLARITSQFARLLATCGPYAAMVGCCASSEQEWRRWFSFARYAAIGYPRNDVLLRPPSARDLLNVDPEALHAMRETRAAGGRVFLYVPTFRDGRPEWIHDIALPELADALARRGDRLVVNLHPGEHSMLPALAAQWPRVRFVRARSDLYPLLAESSALVTDYSSLMFDYLFLDRPVVFFRPDHARYVGDSRRLYDAKVSRMPGPVLDHPAALLETLAADLVASGALYADTRRELRERLFDRVDAQAGPRLQALIAQELDAALA